MDDGWKRYNGLASQIVLLWEELMAFDCVDDPVPSDVDVPDDFEHGIHHAAHRLAALIRAEGIEVA